MLVDTGAMETLLDKSFAKRLSLKSEENVSILMMLEWIEAERMVANYQFANMTFRQPVLVTDLNALSKKVGIQIDMILGHSTMCRLDYLEINYSARRLSLASGDHIDCMQDLPQIHMKFPNRNQAVPVVVDTGVNTLLLFGQAKEYGFVSDLNIPSSGDPEQVRAVFGRVEAVSLADGKPLHNKSAHLVEVPDSASRIGFLGGADLLSVIKINYREDRVTLIFK
jgi:hypothetical protein